MPQGYLKTGLSILESVFVEKQKQGQSLDGNS